ncbi:MAG: YfhO family protein, partial [Anaerolineae bacterium]
SLLVLLVVGLGLSAVQIIPTNELRGLSIRKGGLPYDSLVSFSLPPWQLATLLWPDFWGKPLTTYRGLPNFWEFYVYIGVLPLMLIPFAWGRRANAHVSFLFIMATVSLVLAFGGYTPLYVLLQYVPGFNFFRAPARWLFVTAFSLSILAGFGFSALIKLTNKTLKEQAARWPTLSKMMALTFLEVAVVASAFLLVLQPGDTLGDRYRMASASLRASACPLLFSTLLIGAGFLLLTAYLQWGLSFRAFQIISVGLVAVDLLFANRDVNPLRDPSHFTQEYDSTAFLQKDTSLYRILPMSDDPLDDIRSLMYDVPAMYGLFSVHGGSALVTSRYAAFMDKVDLSDGRLVGLLNVKYVIAHKDEPIPVTLPVAYEDEHLTIYENEAVLPRTFVVHEVEVIPSGQAVLERLVSDDLDPQQAVILEERPPHPIAGASSLPPEDNWARVISYSPHEVVVEAQASLDGFLFLADAYYPGWKAYVDGEEEKIYAADYLFRAVFLPRGEHRVEFRYEPLSFKIGLAITSLTLLVLCVLVLTRTVMRQLRYPDAMYGLSDRVQKGLRGE